MCFDGMNRTHGIMNPRGFGLACLLPTILAAVSAWAGPEAAPYPASPVIAGVDFDFEARDRRAPGSDNWPMTWADDGHQYASWGTAAGSAARTRWAA